MKTIMKFRFHPSIVAIKKTFNSGLSFSFLQVERHEIMKEINNLKTIKATQSTDISTKLIKQNSDIFGDFVFGNYNNCVSNSIFLNSLKNGIITPVHKKLQKLPKIIIDLQVYYQTFLNYRIYYCLSKCQNILNLSHQNFNVGLKIGIVLNSVY